MSGRGERGRWGGGRGRRGGRIAAGMRPVDEATRIDITAAIAEFQASDATEFTFPPGLSNHDRAVVHNECKRMGFSSKSYGKGESRAVTVFKRKEKSRPDPVFDLPLGYASAAAIDEYFQLYPPTEAELIEELDHAYGTGSSGEDDDDGDDGDDDDKEDDNAEKEGGTNVTRKDVPPPQRAPKEQHQQVQQRHHHQAKKGKGRHAAKFDTDEIQRRVQRWESSITRPEMQDIIAARHALPIASYREEIVTAVHSHQVILIAGETGCGKTTQVPQYILEDAWVRGEGCRIICTQPRRISAVSVAERVAAERGESVGDNIGYTIRLETRGTNESSMIFCTNGILLRMLTSQRPGDSALDYVTHLIIDEIHERDRFADFMLIIVRDVLPQYPKLRVILMSATLHIDLFSTYFSGCPVVQVPGFTHPVQDFYLEDILKLTGYQERAVQEVERELSFSRKGGAGGGRVGRTSWPWQ